MKSSMIPRTLLATAVVALTLAVGVSGPAQAKGCIKGALVGGVAGHLAHHGVLGAAGGCVVGHHMASEKAKQDQQQKPSSDNYAR